MADPNPTPGDGAPDGAPDDGSTPLTTRKTPRLGKSFSQRNPLPIGVIGLVFLAVLIFASFNATKLPLIGGGTSYSAYFTESANLKEGDDVRVAGVKVGTVDSVAIDTRRGLVKVSFKVKSGWIGNQSTAYIKIKTLLGAKLLDIESQGTRQLKAGSTIPYKTKNGTQRTFSPFDVYPAFTSLSDTVDQINTKQLTTALNVLGADFTNTPSSVRPLVTGLSRLSNTISSRNAQLRTLLGAADTVTGTLAARDQDLTRILRDGNLLLDELNLRRAAIHSLLLNTKALAVQLNGLVADNKKTLGPLLDNLNSLLNVFQTNQDALDRGLQLLAPFFRVFDNVIGNGTWFDNYICNLSAGGLVLLATGAQADGCGG